MCSQIENHSSAHSACSTCLHRTCISVWLQPILPKCTFHFNLIFKIRIIKRLLYHRGHVMGIGMVLPLHMGLWGTGRWSLLFVLLPASVKADPCVATARQRAPLSLTSLDHRDLWLESAECLPNENTSPVPLYELNTYSGIGAYFHLMRWKDELSTLWKLTEESFCRRFTMWIWKACSWFWFLYSATKMFFLIKVVPSCFSPFKSLK